MVTVVSLLQIMDYVGSLDSSRDLQHIHAKNFVNRFHLVLHTCVEIFDVTFFLHLRVYGGGNYMALVSLTINCKLHCSKLIHPSRWKKCGSLIEIEGEIERAYTEFKQRHRGLSRVPSMLVRWLGVRWFRQKFSFTSRRVTKKISCQIICMWFELSYMCHDAVQILLISCSYWYWNVAAI